MIYELGYDDYEGGDYILLSHEKEYTQKKFDDIVFECSLYAYIQCKKKYNYESDDKILVVSCNDNELWINFDDLYDYICDMLIFEYGFKKIEANVKFNVFNEKLSEDITYHESNDKRIIKLRNDIKKYEQNLLRRKKIEKLL